MAYIFRRVNEVWQEEAKLVPTDGIIDDWFGHDVDLSEYTAIIGPPLDDDMGYISGSVYILFRKYNGTWEEIQKLTHADGEDDD